MRKEMQLRICLFPSGERFPVLLDLDGFPVSLPTRYIIDCHRQSATNTKTVILRTVWDFYAWAQQQTPKLDLESRLRTTDLLTSPEVTSLARFLRMQRKSGIVSFPVGDVGPGEGIAILSNNTFNTYLGRVKAFVLWAAQFLTPISTASKEYEALIKRFDAEMLNWTRRPQRYGLTPDQQAELINFVHPDYPANPFNKPVRFRNYVIVRTLLETGLRRGELCKLRLGDLHLRGSIDPYIEPRRRPNDRLDPRVNEPQVKTRGRIIPIRPSLKDDLFEYLQQHRGKGVRHPYLITDPSNGHPLNVWSIDYIFDRVRETNPQLANVDLTPHICRHTFEGNLLETADKLGWQETKTDRVQKMVSGWTETSHQPANYTARKTEQEAFELIRSQQERANKPS
jgi:integrase